MTLKPTMDAQTNTDAQAANSDTNCSSDEIIYMLPEEMAEGPGMLTATLRDAKPASHARSGGSEGAGEANISVREYIYFLPYPLPSGTEIPYSIHLPGRNPLGLAKNQFEPTTTLVLTSPMKTFIDVRVYKAFNVDAAIGAANQASDCKAVLGAVSTLHSHSSSPQLKLLSHTTNRAIPQGNSQHLDWAFSGTSSSTPFSLPPCGPCHGCSQKRLEESTWQNLTHSTWTHWLDSRFPVSTPAEDIPVDEGDMYPISEDLTLEVGHAFHPELGVEKTHEEMWKDVAVLSTRGGRKICVVLRCQADSAGVRGVVIRLGQYVQGLLKHGDKTTVERWEWNAGASTEKEGWKRSVRVGDGFLPCGVTMRSEVCAVGGRVRFCDFEWRVEEVWEWV